VPGVPIGYPFQLDDGQLDKAINDMLEKANWPGFDNFAALLPELKLALVANGLSERQRREQAAAAADELRVVREQAASAKTALRGTYAILAVSVVALIIAVVSALTA
jgi:hypothetical protein